MEKEKWWMGLLALACFPFQTLASEYTETIDGVTWKYDVYGGEATIASGQIGLHWEYIPAIPDTTTGDITIPPSLGGYPVTSIGDTAFYGCSGLTSVLIPSNVTRIGDRAFENCTGLTSLTIPDKVTSIGMYAFRNCHSLTNVTIPDSMTSIESYAFEACPALYDTNSIPGVIMVDGWAIGFQSLSGDLDLTGTRGIVGNAFSGCSNLTSVLIPASATGLGELAFRRCGNLTNVTILGNIVSDYSAPWDFHDSPFLECSNLTTVVLGGKMTKIGAEMFYGCSGLKAVTIPWSVTSIGESAFYGCTGLKTVSIADSVTDVGNYAFSGCTGLATAYVPLAWKGTTKVYDAEFPSTCSIEYKYRRAVVGDFAWSYIVDNGNAVVLHAFVNGSVDVPSILDGYSVTAIADGAFKESDLLSWITLPESLQDWGAQALPSAMMERLEPDATGLLVVDGWVLGHRNREVSSITVPNGVVGIGSHALANFWDLESVTFPETLKFIAQGAFATNTYLDNVTIPDGVKRIGDRAFQGCTYMRELAMGEGVEQIGTAAFANCSQLSTVTVPESVRGIGDRAFSNCWRMLSVKLPLGLETAGTKIFAGCRSLTGVTMPTHAFTAARLFEDRYQALASVTVAMGETLVCANAFSNCTALSSVALPFSLKEIGYGAFKNCSSLTEIELPGDALARIGEEAFSGAGLTAIVLPDSVTQLGTKAFRNCTTLQNASLSRSLETLTDYVFEGCSKLSTMVVPASVKTLGKGLGNYFQGLYFLGNAPEYDADAYRPRQKSITTYVVRGTRGWDGIPSSRDLPEYWLGYPITYWEPNRFDAHFDANGGAFADGASVWSCEQITGVGYVLPPQSPVQAGAEFGGWWTDPTEGAQIKATTRVNETREITFYAHWKGGGVPVTVRFNANGGTVTPAERTYQSTLTYGELPVPTRIHYQFAGWWTSAEGGQKIVASSRIPGADQELFAHWTPETYAIRFHANGGDGTMQDQSFTYGNPVMLRCNSFTRAKWEFVGWSTSTDGTAVYADGAVYAGMPGNVEDGVVHFFAVWRGGLYAVRFDANGGTGRMDNQTFRFGEEQALSPCQFEREGFRFLGWSQTSGGGVVFANGATVVDLADEANATAVLYAVWKKVAEDAGLPEVGSSEEVAGVLEEAADPRLAERIQTVDDYNAFRAWALGVKNSEGQLAGVRLVLAAPHAWPSYLLGAETLFRREPDIRLGGFEVGRQGGTTMRVSVTVWDGGKSVAVDATKVATLFECTGSLEDWTGVAAMDVTATQTDVDDNTIWYEVTPGDGETGRAFLRISESAKRKKTTAQYLVVDLSDGSEAKAWPVEYLNEEPIGGFNTGDYKTTKLVLRRIEAGTFMMGGEFQTTLTKPYYMGIFEVTQKQWELVTGITTNPTPFKGAMRPVDCVSHDMIRGNSAGTDWPTGNAVDPSSFMGKLRSRTGLKFDLPTEAQWEYACRAGTTTDLNSGKNLTNSKKDSAMNEVGRYAYNSGESIGGDGWCDGKGGYDYGPTTVGCYLPNAWGLYDMHGNVSEKCLDWYGDLESSGTDPTGPYSGESRVLRGGCWYQHAIVCTASARSRDSPTRAFSSCGFRLVANLSR